MRKTYTIEEVIEREKMASQHKNPLQNTINNKRESKPKTANQKMKKYIFIGLAVLLTYVAVFVFHAATTGIDLGKNYRYKYFHDGYRVTHNGASATSSDVVGFNVDTNYIIGEMKDPYSWSKENYDTTYFVLNKKTNAKAMELNKSELEQLCEKLNIKDCEIRGLSMYSLMLEPTYWQMRYTDE